MPAHGVLGDEVGKTAVSRRRPATLGPTSNTLPTTPATYLVLETGPLGTGQWHGGYGDRHGGFARVSVEATSSSKDKTTHLLITHSTRLDKLPKARTMHEVIRSIWAKKGGAARHPLQTQRSGKPASRAPCPFSIYAVLATILSYVFTHDPSPSLR